MFKQVRRKKQQKFWIRWKKNEEKAWQKKSRAGKILMLIFPFGFIQMKIGIIYNVKLLFFFLFLSAIELNCDCIGFAGPSNWFSSAFFFMLPPSLLLPRWNTLLTKCIENNYNSWRLTFQPRKESETTEQLNKWTREIQKTAPRSNQRVSEMYKRIIMKS